MTTDTLARIMVRHHLTRRDVLLCVIFARGHAGQSITRALWDYLHGLGPAAIAAGRAVAGGRRLAPDLPPHVPFWQKGHAA